jgi:hypothetical protein
MAQRLNDLSLTHKHPVMPHLTLKTANTSIDCCDDRPERLRHHRISKVSRAQEQAGNEPPTQYLSLTGVYFFFGSRD